MITIELDRRVLGAIRFVSSVTGLPITTPIRISHAPASAPAANPGVPPLKILRNRHALYVIHSAPGFSTYIAAFDPVPAVANQTLSLRASDPSGGFFPGTFGISLPRTLNSVRVNGEYDGGSVFRPIAVPLLPAPAATLNEGWAVLRVELEEIREQPPASGNFIPAPARGALIRVFTDPPNPLDRELLGRGLIEWRAWPQTPPMANAEGIVVVPGIPLTNFSNQPNGAVLTQNQSVRVQVRIDRNFVAGAEAIPDLARLEATNPPLGVVSAELTNPLILRRGARISLRLRMDQNGVLQTL